MNPHLDGRPIKVGLIGAGNWANHGHLRVLDLLPDYEVVAVQARRREAAEAAAARFGIASVVATAEELAATPGLDLVLVLNTAPQHADTVRTVIAAGKDVYCEWPLTVDIATAHDLLRLARDRGVRHLVGLQRRLAPHNRYLRDLLTDGFVGRLRSVRMHVSTPYFHEVLPRALAWTVPPENFSSVVAIYAGHFLDMLFQAVGWPERVSALLVNQFPEVRIAETGERIPTTNPDQLVLSGLLADGAVLSVHVEGGKRGGSGVRIDVTGDAGDLSIANTSAFGDVGDNYVVAGARGESRSLAPLPVPATYQDLPASSMPASSLPSAVLELGELYAAFAHDRQAGTRTTPNFEDAVRLHRFFDALARSSASGRRVDVA